MGRVFVSKNGSIRSYPYTRNPQINSWLSWKTEVLRQFLFNLILNQVVGRQVLAMASSIQFRKMEWGYGVFLSTLEKDADLIEQKSDLR